MRDPEAHDARFARALAEADAYRRRRGSGAAEEVAAWLCAHEDLRELLEPMLEADGAGSEPDGAAKAEALRRFAHFQILSSLGGGGMGDVYLALDEKLGRKVALKLIRPEALWSQDAKLRFHRETLAVGRLDHTNVCRLYEAGEHEGWPFMALQYIEGETLAQKIAKARAAGPLRDLAASSSAPASRADIVTVVALFEQVARALHHAHEHGLVHRDIKPGNIMIASDGRPVVLDFGLVRDEQNLGASLSSSRRGVGTPLYMSPEQVLHTGRIDARTDVYSLGVTLYECLTHERPFDAATEAELAQAILANVYRDPRRRNRQVPPELGLVLACALDRDPERRYRTALALAEDLRRVTLLQPVHARPIGTALRLRRWAQRNPRLLALGSLAGVALLGLVVAVERGSQAKAQEGLASARGDEARASRASFRLLSDVVKLKEAKDIEPTLYPALPERVPALRAWVREKAEPLAQRLPLAEAALVELRKRAKGDPPEYTFADRGDRFLHQALSQLVDDLHAFVGQEGELSAVRKRLLEAETVHETTIGQHRVEWDAAIAAIAKSDGVVASRLYDHLVLSPQVGLVPIGMDPDSKLWEFAQVASGAMARRDSTTGRLVLADATGIVFVLLPPGTFWMGEQKEDPRGRNYYREALPLDSPVHPVTLSAFFLAKHEMTQGQWQLLADGATPSEYKAGTVSGGQAITNRNPVESVNWSTCDALLTRQGLLLPTEAQWEYGCRAGSTTTWWTGAEKDSLRTPRLAENLAQIWRGLDDGYGVHAPVGCFAPNDFGLHDMHGNVAEWCRDRFHPYTVPPRPDDGFRLGGIEPYLVRGGSFYSSAVNARSALRLTPSPTARKCWLGLRPARCCTP